MKLLVVCVPQAGHVGPMLPLVRALTAGGDEVVVASAESLRSTVEDAGASLYPAGSGFEKWYERLRARTRGTPGAGLPPDRILRYFLPRLFAEVGADDMIDDVMAAGERLRPDAVMFDAGALAGPLAADLLGVPGVQHLFGAPLATEVLQLARDAISPLWQSFERSVLNYAGVYRGLTIAICPPSLEPSRPPEGELTYLRPAPLPQRPAEPADRPVVYVTMGTQWGDPTVVQAVLDGLADEPIDVVVTTGQLDPGTLSRIPANARAERFIPQAELLPRCAAVVHHAGAGTMFGVLAHGLPQVALPQAADNFINAELVEQSGAARVLRPGEVTAESVRDSVREVLSQPSYRAAAQRIAREIAAMPAPEQVADHLRARYGSSR